MEPGNIRMRLQDIWPDEDHAAVRQLFKLLHEYGDELEPDMQMIIFIRAHSNDPARLARQIILLHSSLGNNTT
jgi:hypothetical protein